MKLAVSLSLDNSQGLIEAIAKNIEDANNQINVNQLFAAIDAVSPSDVNAVKLFIWKIAFLLI